MTTTPLVAGPEMDHLVATRIFGWTYEGGHYYQTPPRMYLTFTVFETLPHYSTDLGAAAAVLDWLSVRGHVVLSGQQGNWDCQVDSGRAFCVENGDTPAEAICRLALAVKEDAGVSH